MEIWREATKRANKDPKYWLAFLPAGVCAGIGSLFGILIGSLFGILGAGIGGGIGGALSIPLIVNAARPHVAAVLEERKNRSTIGESKQ